jgi:2-phosphosulfolactate phosphatase
MAVRLIVDPVHPLVNKLRAENARPTMQRSATARRIDVFLLPALVEPDELTGKIAVVIDVLRATTTIVHALAAGAAQVVPCLEVDDARRVAAEAPGQIVLGGERFGLPIPGFDLGNSPADYTGVRVGGKTVAFTTTNGTRAMQHCRAARRVLIGAFVNFSAVCRELLDEHDIALVCAGTNGHVTREDTLFAGAVVHELANAVSTASGGHEPPEKSAPVALNDQAEIAADAWRACANDLTQYKLLGSALRASRGGRNLIDTGQENDIDLAAQIDRFDLVPELDLATWRIRST